MELFIRNEHQETNPSSIHSAGRKARAMLSAARNQLHSFLFPEDTNVNARIIFTAGGTESCNLMHLGFLGGLNAFKYPAEIVVSAIEHPAVIEVCRQLEQAGWLVHYVAPAVNGILGVEDFLDVVSDKTSLVSVMAANNETGALQPIAAITEGLRKKGYSGPIVSDCTQAAWKSNISFTELFAKGVNAIALSGHKLGAPAGIGALVIAETSGHKKLCFPFTPLQIGGPQEQRFRAGTENLIGAIAFGAAVEEIADVGLKERESISELREYFWKGLRKIEAQCIRYTPQDTAQALSNTLLVGFPSLRGDDFVVALDLEDVCASTGSACSSGKQDISHVLTAMGLDKVTARSVVRFSLDWNISKEDIDEVLSRIKTVHSRMHKIELEEKREGPFANMVEASQ